ncbi:hypothetical protein GE09DRAFT_1224873 [Coniochaeta sp. 2T2.1]|nr:hypothetical protein GE09DRAFT_1224873 [Coniochaeta sp. 2T2.1]
MPRDAAIQQEGRRCPPTLEEYGLQLLAEAERRQQAARDTAMTVDKAEARYSRSLKELKKFIRARQVGRL